ncbi:hypothetical protein ECG_04692 [Echinococcus granulosus]|nr:hypothetical protein ECG_04692 [Echinococcus granulosus]
MLQQNPSQPKQHYQRVEVDCQLIERRSSLRRIFDVTGGGNAGGVRYLGSDLLCPLETDFNFKNSSLEETS